MTGRTSAVPVLLATLILAAGAVGDVCSSLPALDVVCTRTHFRNVQTSASAPGVAISCHRPEFAVSLQAQSAQRQGCKSLSLSCERGRTRPLPLGVCSVSRFLLSIRTLTLRRGRVTLLRYVCLTRRVQACCSTQAARAVPDSRVAVWMSAACLRLFHLVKSWHHVLLRFRVTSLCCCP